MRRKKEIPQLHHAAEMGQTNIVSELIARGADCNELDRSGRTPLDLAKLNRHKKTARALRGAGGRTADEARQARETKKLELEAMKTEVEAAVLRMQGLDITVEEYKYRKETYKIAQERRRSARRFWAVLSSIVFLPLIPCLFLPAFRFRYIVGYWVLLVVCYILFRIMRFTTSSEVQARREYRRSVARTQSLLRSGYVQERTGSDGAIVCTCGSTFHQRLSERRRAEPHGVSIVRKYRCGKCGREFEKDWYYYGDSE